MPLVTAADRLSIDSVEAGFHGVFGEADDIGYLRMLILSGSSTDKLGTACEIGIAYIHLVSDLQQELRNLRHELKKLQELEHHALSRFGEGGRP